MTLPLLMVSQIQRSGGSLMAQLFDGHPQLHAHPFEIQIGYPKKWNWPSLNLDGPPAEWFELLYEKKLDEFIVGGYKKPGSNPHAHREVFAFNFDKHQFREAFERRLQETPPSSARIILNVYFEEFFSAWLDHTTTGHEKFVSGFTPRLFMMDPLLQGFHADYPDGIGLSVIRDPKSWYASSSRHSGSYADPDKALDEWAHSTRASLALQKQFPERFKCLLFRDLVGQTAQTMQQVCLFAGIDYVNSLTEPTFLGEAVFPNSSFEIDKKGINQDMLDRDSSLTPEELATIEDKARPLYDEAVASCALS